jgi:hypothetical protein
MNQQQINFRDKPLAEEMRPHFLGEGHLTKLWLAKERALINGDSSAYLRILNTMRVYRQEKK